MKKYVKPELFYEKFELSQHIAGTCVWVLNSANGECAASCEGMDNMTLFSSGVDCYFDSEVYENYCYTTGSDGMNVFAS